MRHWTRHHRLAFFVCVPLLVAAAVLSHAGRADGVEKMTYGYVNENGEREFKLVRYKNANGAVQVDARYVEGHGILPDTQRPVLYGRDLDGDGYPETWAYREDNYIENVYYHAPANAREAQDDPFGTGAIGEIVRDLELSNRWLVAIAAEKAGGWIFSAMSGARRAWDDFFLVQLDVLELQIRADELPAGSPEAIYLDALAEQTWTLAQKDLQKELGVRYWKRGAIDIATWLGGMKAAKWAGAAKKWVGKKIVATGAGRAMATSLETFSEKIVGRATALASRLGLKPAQAAGMETAARTISLSVYGLNLQAAKAATMNAIRGATAKSKFASMVLGALGKTGTIYKTGFGNWKYVLQTQMTQILAEGWARRNEIYDPNPIVMAGNLFTEKEFLQNLAYMGHETVLMSGVHAGEGTVPRRLMIAGVLSLLNSTQMNLLVKGDLDPKRVGLDTGWEVAIGNVQTLVDVTALKYFDQLAAKQRSPKLRLLGYAIAFVDQTVGFFGYAKATEAIRPDATEPAKKAAPPSQTPQVRLVPIVAM